MYLHGLGSCRLEALTLVPSLPKHYSLCMFDMSGGGKSEGTVRTYGKKESEDVGRYGSIQQRLSPTCRSTKASKSS